MLKFIKMLDAAYKASIWAIVFMLMFTSGLLYRSVLDSQKVITAGERAYSECHNDKGYIFLDEPMGLVR